MEFKVTHDPNRNQLARVIENALCFQDNGRYADDVYVALVTPARFKDTQTHTKEYQRIFGEYETDNANLLRDLDSCVLPKRKEPNWHYPSDIGERVKKLKLRWPTYEDLFTGIPDSPISGGLMQFWEQYGH